MQTRVSLSPESESGSEARHWATFSDVALAMLLVFILFILAQFLQYERIFVLEEVARRQAIVEESVLATDAPDDSVAIEVVIDDDFTQRIRITGAQFFQECSERLSSSGSATLASIGEALQTRAEWFEAIQVEGHADRQAPTGRICIANGIQDNWQLSARRATEVVRTFSTAGVVPNGTLSSVGRGEFSPLSAAGDTTRAALQQDRRIELVIRYSDDGILEEREGE